MGKCRPPTHGLKQSQAFQYGIIARTLLAHNLSLDVTHRRFFVML